MSFLHDLTRVATRQAGASAGIGLDLTSTTFSIKSGYQLPQSCSNGQVPKSDGSGGWSCQADGAGGLPGAWTASQGQNVILSNHPGGVDIVSVSLPAGNYQIEANANLIPDNEADQSDGCDLVIGGQIVDSLSWADRADEPLKPFSLIGIGHLSAAGTATLHCASGAQNIRDVPVVESGRIVASQVGTLTTQ